MGYSLNQKEIRARMAADYLAERKARNPAMTPSRTFVNSTQTLPYTGPNFIEARPEGKDFLNIASKGM